MDVRKDMLARMRPGQGPFEPGESVFYYKKDKTKLKGGGQWLKARVVSTYTDSRRPMVTIEYNNQQVTINKTLLRKNPDPWHDVVIPNLTVRGKISLKKFHKVDLSLIILLKMMMIMT